MKKIFTFICLVMAVSTYAAEPVVAPTAPTQAAENVKALFCSAYDDLGFEPTQWGTAWSTSNVQGTSFFYTESIGWDCFTNWGSTEYDLSGYPHFCIDMYAEQAGSISICFESKMNVDPKVSYPVKLVAGWNKFDLDVKDCYPGVTFKHILYMTLEGCTIEGTNFAVANAYFYKEGSAGIHNTVADVKKASKAMENGKVVIMKNGMKYNAAGQRM